MDFKALVKRARSVRRFDNSHKLNRDILMSIVDTARYAPSARNGQTLKYMLIDAESECERLFPLLRWAGYLADWDGPEESERPVAYIVLLHDKTLGAYNAIDAGLTTQCMVLAAAEQGLATCIIGAMERENVIKTLAIDTDRYDMIHIIALGKGVETVIVEDMMDGDIKYWRDDSAVHHVPKRTIDEVIIR